jgi:type IV secretion system protein VirD4
MRGGRFGSGMNLFMQMHRSTVEQDHAALARARADAMAREMARARPTGALGNGRLAQAHDITSSGLFGNNGLFLGAHQGRLLFYEGDAPLLTIAMTGSGKGRDYILANLAHLRGRSAFVLDLKSGENAYGSAQYRQQELGEKCIFLDPFGVLPQFPAAKINPLQLLVDITQAGKTIDTEAMEIAQILLPRGAKSGSTDWVVSGAARLAATVFEHHAYFSPETCTFESLWRFVNASEFETNASFALMETSGNASIAGRAASFHRIRNEAPKQYEAYASAIADAIVSFAPGSAIAHATSANEFDFAKMKQEPHVVYFIIPSEKLDTAAPYISATINFAIERIAAATGPIKTTLFLDELAQLKPMRSLLRALLLYRGRGIQPWSFLQSRTALDDAWGKENARQFETQAAVMTMRGIDDPTLIRDISLWSGQTSILSWGASHNGAVVNSANANLSETKRSVLQAEDIMGLGASRQIIKVTNMPHLIVADCVPFFDIHPWRDAIKDVRLLNSGENP